MIMAGHGARARAGCVLHVHVRVYQGPGVGWGWCRVPFATPMAFRGPRAAGAVARASSLTGRGRSGCLNLILHLRAITV
jgi:hypothetical protein